MHTERDTLGTALHRTAQRLPWVSPTGRLVAGREERGQGPQHIRKLGYSAGRQRVFGRNGCGGEEGGATCDHGEMGGGGLAVVILFRFLLRKILDGYAKPGR